MKNRFYLGWVRVRAEGGQLERLLQILAYHNIILWNVHRSGAGILASMYVNDFFRIKEYVKKTGVTVRCIKRHGLPFYVQNWKRHASVAAGIGLAIGLLAVLSRYIWGIEVDGNRTCSDEQIITFLETEGIHTGMLSSALPDAESLELSIRTMFPEIIWVTTHTKGSVLHIHVKENDTRTPRVEDTSPQSLVAESDATISSIVTRSGTPQVKAGEVVKKGQLLVSGIVPVLGDYDALLGMHEVRADADIVAEWEITFQRKIPRVHEIVRETGDAQRAVSISFGSRRFLFCYRKKEGELLYSETAHKLFPGVSIGIHTLNRAEWTNESRSDEALERLAEEELREYLQYLQKNKVQILKKSGTIQLTTQECVIDYRIRVRGRFGVAIPISEDEKGLRENEHN